MTLYLSLAANVGLVVLLWVAQSRWFKWRAAAKDATELAKKIDADAEYWQSMSNEANMQIVSLSNRLLTLQSRQQPRDSKTGRRLARSAR